MGCLLKMKIVIDIWHLLTSEEFKRVTGLSWTLSLLHSARSSGFPAVLPGSQRLPWSASGAGGQQERALSLPFSFNQICFPWIQGFEWRHCLKTTFLYWRVWNERPTEWNSVPQWVWGNLTSWSGSHWPYGMSWASSDPRNTNFPEDLLALMSLCEWIPCSSSSLSFLDTFHQSPSP